jgi:thiamine biosynthesis protein ThiS
MPAEGSAPIENSKKPLLRFFLCAEDDMQIVLNGEPAKSAEGTTVAALLLQLGISRERVAVELNADIVPKVLYEKQILVNGDRIEIVHFVGGGSPK